MVSGLIFIFSSLTDLLDGYIARKYDMKTKIGKVLDPLADKLTVISILILLLFVGLVPRIILIIILSREIIILLSSMTAYFMGKNLINPTRLGKLSITILYIAIALILLEKNLLANIMLYISIPLNLTSAFDYIATALKNY